MRIALDLRPVSHAGNRFRGIGVYVSNLVAALLKQNSGDEYWLLVDAQSVASESARWRASLAPWNVDSVHVVGLTASEFFSWRHHYELYRALRRYQVDVYHFPSQSGLAFLPGVRSVVTVHDLVYLRFPELYLRHTGIVYQSKMSMRFASLRRADRIVAISNHTKDDVIQLLAIDERTVDVVYNGVSPAFAPIMDHNRLAAVADKYQLPAGFLLYVGGFDERKNIGRLFGAFADLRREAGPGCVLAVAGRVDDEGQRLIRHLQETHSLDGMKFLGFVDDDDLVALYNGCRYLVFPSLYEGFGLPVIEAMKCGKTCVTSRTSSLGEIAGDAAITVDPVRQDEILAAMRELYYNASLRRILETKAIVQASGFTWTNTAREVRRVYDHVSLLTRPKNIAQR